MDQYDLMVIGGGPAGYLAAQRSAQKGNKVILFDGSLKQNGIKAEPL